MKSSKEKEDALTYEYLTDTFNYDSDTGIFTYKVTKSSRAVQGNRAGTLNNIGYRVIKIGKYLYLEHRLAWFYAFKEWPEDLLDHINRIRDDNTTYNTYKVTGLPKDPVCAVSLDAIKAAIFPVKSEYVYFVRDNKTGLHKFATTYEEHQVNIKSNVGVAKTYTKVKADETQIDAEAENIMKTDVTKQKPVSIKDLFKDIN